MATTCSLIPPLGVIAWRVLRQQPGSPGAGVWLGCSGSKFLLRPVSLFLTILILLRRFWLLIQFTTCLPQITKWWILKYLFWTRCYSHEIAPKSGPTWGTHWKLRVFGGRADLNHWNQTLHNLTRGRLHPPGCPHLYVTYFCKRVFLATVAAPLLFLPPGEAIF